MQQYIVRRALLNVLVIFMVITMVFLGLRLTPGDFAVRQAGAQIPQHSTEEAKEIVRHDLGLDKPMPKQYWEFVSGLFQGDLGDSFVSKEPVMLELKDRLAPSIELGILQIAVAIMVAVPIGIISAIRQDTWLDYILRMFAIFWLAVPSFFVGVLLLYSLARWAHWSPPITNYKGFFDDPLLNMQAMFLPALAGGLAIGAIIMRFLRSQMLEVLRQDYVRTAWSKGLRERAVVLRHALKNALIPVLTVISLLLATVVSGNVVLETLFQVPGIGFYVVNAIQQYDYPVVQGVVLVMAAGLVFVNLLVDMTYAWLDPRIRYG
ncbi:MAG: ABC transporter permease [Dehalococcoidia bacterium]|nr:MAG: ABC transporter permease [Dehalococcoidia bacterium]